MMRTLKRGAAMAIALGIVSLFGMAAVYLALTDIWRGEPDVRAEWTAVRAGLASIVLFQITALAILAGILRLPSD